MYKVSSAEYCEYGWIYPGTEKIWDRVDRRDMGTRMGLYILRKKVSSYCTSNIFRFFGTNRKVQLIPIFHWTSKSSHSLISKLQKKGAIRLEVFQYRNPPKIQYSYIIQNEKAKDILFGINKFCLRFVILLHLNILFINIYVICTCCNNRHSAYSKINVA